MTAIVPTSAIPKRSVRPSQKGAGQKIYNERIQRGDVSSTGVLPQRLSQTLNNVWGWRLPFYLAAAFPVFRLLTGGLRNLFESSEAHLKEGVERKRNRRGQSVIYNFLSNQRFLAGLLRVGCASGGGVCLGLFGIWSLPLTLALWAFGEALIKGLKLVEDAKALEEPDDTLASQPSSLQDSPSTTNTNTNPPPPPAERPEPPPPGLPAGGGGLTNPNGNSLGGERALGANGSPPSGTISIANQQLGGPAGGYLPPPVGYAALPPGGTYTKYVTNNYYGKGGEDGEAPSSDTGSSTANTSPPSPYPHSSPYGGRSA